MGLNTLDPAVSGLPGRRAGSPPGICRSPRTLPPNLPGAGLGALREGVIVDFEKFGTTFDGLPIGVAMAFWVLRSGDSGRGKDGRDLGFSAGLAALRGPTDWVIFDVEGVGGVPVVFKLLPPTLNAANDGVVGVGGKESVEIV